jgi:hypothetical protein
MTHFIVPIYGDTSFMISRGNAFGGQCHVAERPRDGGAHAKHK